MKSLLFLFVLFSLLSSCESGSSTSIRFEAGNSPKKDAVRTDFITGKITEVQMGKDGYTARLVTEEGQVYFATISRANLKENAAQYRSATVGDTLRLRGDIWQAGDETHVTVRELAE